MCDMAHLKSINTKQKREAELMNRSMSNKKKNGMKLRSFDFFVCEWMIMMFKNILKIFSATLVKSLQKPRCWNFIRDIHREKNVLEGKSESHPLYLYIRPLWKMTRNLAKLAKNILA